MKAHVMALLVLAGCATATNQREAYIQSHPDLPSEYREALRRNEVIEGMTAEQVRLVLGRPDSVLRTSDRVELWEYNHAALTFRDGLLDHWIERRVNR